MLSSFKLDNFRSFNVAEFKPAGVNVLLGANNTGKTNLCKALKLIHRSATVPLAEAISQALGDNHLSNVYRDDDDVSLEVRAQLLGGTHEYKYTLTIAPDETGWQLPAFQIRAETLTLKKGKGRPVHLIKNESGHVATKAGDEFEYSTAPTDATILSRLYDRTTHSDALLFRDYLQRWRFFDVDPTTILQGLGGFRPTVLLPDGSNLFPCIHLKKSWEEGWYRQYIEFVRRLEPQLNTFNFYPIAEDRIYTTVQFLTGQALSTSALSSGTLRFMALTFAILDGFSNMSSGPGLTVFEEPENGLYVRQFEQLFRLFDLPAHVVPQFVFTTHSPHLVDMFEHHLDGVHILRKDEYYSSLARAHKDDLEEHLLDLSLGEAFFRELLL